MTILSPQDEQGEVTDMMSFYTLPSTVMHHPVHKQLKAAYSFYNVSKNIPLVDLMQDALILAKQVTEGGTGVFCFAGVIRTYILLTILIHCQTNR